MYPQSLRSCTTHALSSQNKSSIQSIRHFGAKIGLPSGRMPNRYYVSEQTACCAGQRQNQRDHPGRNYRGLPFQQADLTSLDDFSKRIKPQSRMATDRHRGMGNMPNLFQVAPWTRRDSGTGLHDLTTAEHLSHAGACSISAHPTRTEHLYVRCAGAVGAGSPFVQDQNSLRSSTAKADGLCLVRLRMDQNVKA